MRVFDRTTVETSGFLLAALEQASEAVILIDSDLHIAHFNAAAEQIWGVPREEVLGLHANLLGIIDLGPHSEITLQRGDGSRLRAAQSVSRVEVDGRSSYLAFVRDISTEVERRERLAMMNLVADKTSRAVVITDRRMRIIYTNAAFSGIYGYSPADVLGRRADHLLAGRYTDGKTRRRLLRHLCTGSDDEEEILTYDKNGDEVWISASVRPFRNKRGRIKSVFALLTDITENKQLRSLQQLITNALADELPLTEIAAQLCRRVEVIAPDVVCSLLHIDADGRIHPLGGPSLPEAYSRALDGVAIGPDVGSCGSAAYYGEPVLASDIDNDPRWQPFKAMPLAAGLKACWSTPIKANDGRVIATFAFYFREPRAPSRWHKHIVDACVHLGALAIERKEARAQIARLAFHDMLTGLPNRTQLRYLVDQAIEDCRGGQLALLFLDLDHFKDVNDTLGHSAGDTLLIEFAKRLRACIQPSDLLGRLSGDEFVIMLPDCDPARASRVASHITEALASPLWIDNRQVPISASIGISIYPDNATDLDALIQQADAAMYKAKQAGRSTHRFFSADMNRLAEQRLVLSAALRHAIADDRLKLFYQPQTRTVDGALYGVEALARWHDPDLGEVPPSKFIPLAEEVGLIEQIGLWSIREACRQMAAWRRAGLDIPCVAVNLSPLNFQNTKLATVVEETIAANGLPAEALMLEITEGVLVNERSAAIATMNAIRTLGVGLSLDDFGTGYSSLSRLAHLPIRELKIDRSFMRDIERDASALAITTAVVRVGQSLKMTVVAEGVETEGQRQLLAGLGCDVVQGYLYAPAMPPEAFERWLLDHVAGQARAMRERIEQARPQTAPSQSMASTGG
ncbi:EAL domain-containing protein [Bradyrhizobium roseum]|uniref:EAL domain-containing protein n=1 Tax=Bradyrhizobium roseum TaxID=3056648 RepID=UPI00261B71D1|nr:EAL domain-containing protein [Bradyrhizobium roseus]WKA29413.1 EAL domain-containing protein [Bradyrhizobium roseus]